MDIFFHQNPIFRIEQFTAFKAQAGTQKRAAIQQALQYYLRKKRIISIRRGLFAVVPPGTSADNLNIDPYALAGMLTEDSVLSYHSALELHGFAYSLFRKQTFKTKHKIKSFEFGETLFQPVYHKRFVQAPHLYKSFTVSINRNGTDIRMTSLACTYVDVLDRPELCGGWEEVYRCLSSISVLPIDDAIKYCLALESPVLCAKLGFFLEQREGAFAVSQENLNLLLSHRPKSPYYLAGKSKEPSRYHKKWNLMIPESHLSKAWEEPNAEF